MSGRTEDPGRRRYRDEAKQQVFQAALEQLRALEAADRAAVLKALATFFEVELP